MTIVSVIHQPRSSLWSLYDWAILLSKGTCVYQGLSNLEDLLLTQFNHLNLKCDDYECPADHVLDVLQNEPLGIHKKLEITYLTKVERSKAKLSSKKDIMKSRREGRTGKQHTIAASADPNQISAMHEF